MRLWATFPDVRVEATGPRLSDGHSSPRPEGAGDASRRGGRPAATGRFLVVHAVFYCELDETEKLWRIRTFFDLYDAAKQLGVLAEVRLRWGEARA